MAKSKAKTEKALRKERAAQQRLETPPMIVPPVNTESDDLKEAATMKLRPTDDNPTSDQAANDPTINTVSADDPPPVDDDVINEEVVDDAPPVGEEAPQRSPTNEELAEASRTPPEFEPDPIEVYLAEKALALRAWFDEFPDKFKQNCKNIHDATINAWIAFGDAAARSVDKLYVWADKQNTALRWQWRKWFPSKATRDELFEVVSRMGEMFTFGLEEVKQQIAAKNTIDTDRLDKILLAHKNGQKVKAATLYANLTNIGLMEAKAKIEALA